MKITRSAVSTAVTLLALLILIAAIPSAVRDTLEASRVHLFSRQFLEELPPRLTGPGKFRFVLQPLVAIFLGWRSGLSDAAIGRRAYLYDLFAGGVNRKALLHSGLTAIRDLLAMAVVLDAVAQLLIYRQVHPGAAIVVGSVVIAIPYALARTLTTYVVASSARRSSVRKGPGS
jgi:hypothetical protein